MGVDDLGLMAGALQKGSAVAQFEGQMRLAAAEVDAAVEGPGGIYQADFHTASFRVEVRAGFAPTSQPCSRPMPSATPT